MVFPLVSCFKITNWDALSLCIRIFNDGFFRGHGNADWNLSTTLERRYSSYCKETDLRLEDPKLKGYNREFFKGAFSKNLLYTEEYAAIQTYKRLNFLQENLSAIKTLAMMQHYGGATRLLDVTTSFLIALFFAFEEYGTQDRAVWFFNHHYFYKNSPLVLDKVKSEFRFAEEREIYSNLVSNKELLYNESLSCADKCFHQSEPTEKECLSIIPLTITGNNPRLVAQNGAFLFPTTLHPFEKHLFSILKISSDEFENMCNDVREFDIKNIELPALWQTAVVKLIFPADIRCFVKDFLSAANISAKSIYPDQIGIAKSIKYW